MDKNDLERVKADIETIKEAAGLDLPFGWDSVWTNVILQPLIGIGFLIYAWLVDKPSGIWMAIPVAILLGSKGYQRYRYRRSTGRSPAKRKEYGSELYRGAIIGLVAGGYLWWARAKGLDTAYIGCGLVLMAGAFEISNAFITREHLHRLGDGIPLFCLGLTLLLWTTPDIVILNGCLTLTVAGIATGLIQARQIKASERINATH
jgi:hypothetical protein